VPLADAFLEAGNQPSVRPVKILMVTGAIPDVHANTGASIVMAGQVGAVSARHRVTLVTFAPENSAQIAALEHWRSRGVTVHTTTTRIPAPVVRAKRRIERALKPRGPQLEPTTGDAPTQAVIDGVLASNDFDLIQVESIGVGSFRYPASIPKVLTEHEVGRFASGVSDEWRVRQPTIWEPFDRIQVFTARDAATLASAAPALAARVRVNPFGIDLPAASDPQRVEPDSVVFVGSFNHRPNVDAAVWLVREILPLVAARYPGVRLSVVGEDPPDLVTRLSQHNVVVTGRVPDVTPYLESAAVVVAPVRIGGGMRQKVLHALALGKAVVTTSLGTEGLVGEASELPLGRADAAEHTADHILRLLGHPEERRALGLRARDFVAQHHSWTAYGDRLDAIYQELVGS